MMGIEHMRQLAEYQPHKLYGVFEFEREPLMWPRYLACGVAGYVLGCVVMWALS